MDLYNAILNKGGQILQDGSAWVDFISKDGTKIIRQIAQKNGTSSIDIFEKATAQPIQAYRKVMKPKEGAYTTKVYNYIKQAGKIFSIQKLQTPQSFMMTKFDTGSTGKIVPKGEFFSSAQGQVKKGAVTYFPVGVNNINTSDSKIKLPVTTFNKMFGAVERQIF
ncbi:MAG: hypothetical protein IJ877_03960 [Candidatus Gastranaerophilales bacterium]|nr:hypothetical protein [Candidatus Gastranaerophilales bacterium]